MSIIYQPSGKAREYSPLSANFYNGCEHGCKYCYAPSIKYMSPEQFHQEAIPRKNIISELKKDALKYKNCTNQVLFNFMHDPYCKADEDHQITKKALEIFLENKIPVSILTKGGKRILRDLDIIKQYGQSISVGATLTFDNDKDSLEWEPGASIPLERIETLEIMKKNGVKTWASFEPVIIPEQSINLILKTLECVDTYKIGKINNYQGIDKKIDWTSFLSKVVEILRENKKPFYVKHDLRIAAPSIKLYGNEILPDEFQSNQFEKELFLFT